ncbi:AMP-binding protein [Photobacterium swingsii]|uniref:AMP-binding protein n=1 Tax=Photobacterium swingsii TaxID=680026 RepID=UPI004068B549
MTQTIPYTSLANVMLEKRPADSLVAFQDDTQWQQFHHDVCELAAYLNTQPQVRWALCFADSYYFAVAFMALSHSGKHIILPGNHQPAALAELSEQFDILLHDDEVAAIANTPSLTLPFTAQARTTVSEYDLATLALDTLKLTLFTSGSSGTPKAIEKSLSGIAAEIDVLESIWGKQLQASKITSTVSHQHIYGLLFRVLWPLCSGRAFARHDLIYPEQVMAQASSDTCLISSPALLKRLVDMTATAPYRQIFSSGGPLPHTAAQHSQALFNHLPIEVFGSTETGGIGYRQQHEATTPWQLFPCHQVMLNAEQCLRLQSPFIDTKAWYQTSDQCELLPNNQFQLKGRADRIVKIEEKRISLVDVEQRLSQLAWVEEAAVLPLDEGHRLILGAVITLTPEGQQALVETGKGKLWLAIRQQLRQWLEPVGIPRRFRAVDEIPLNSQGKRQFQALVTLFSD